MKQLKIYRKNNHLTQEDLAHLLGISHIHVVSIENGRRRPSIRLAKKIEEITNGAVTVQMIADEALKTNV